MILLNPTAVLGNTLINVSRNSGNRETLWFAVDIDKMFQRYHILAWITELNLEIEIVAKY